MNVYRLSVICNGVQLLFLLNGVAHRERFFDRVTGKHEITIAASNNSDIVRYVIGNVDNEWKDDASRHRNLLRWDSRTVGIHASDSLHSQFIDGVPGAIAQSPICQDVTADRPKAD
jgi:hypothetical protein